MRFPRSGLIAVCLSLTVPADAAMTGTGNELLETCKNESSMFSSGACLGFVQGVTEGLLLQAGTFKQKPLVCLPEGVTFGQMRDVVVKYLSEHPELRHYTGAQLTVLALANAWKCDFSAP